jgi:5'(3')-deoxyribonucleotidase
MIIPNQTKNKGEGRLPHHFVTFVEIFFAVVLGASILEFHTFLFPPDLTSPSFWALITVYFVAVTSWIGWHKSTTEFPYTDSGAGYLRSLLDAVIVGNYAALLFFGSTVENSFFGSRVDNSLLYYLWGFFIVFFLYYISGRVRRAEYSEWEPSEVSKLYLIERHGYVLLIAAIAYTVLHTILPEVLFQLPTGVLWLFIVLPFATMVSYRSWREWRNLSWAVRTKRTIAVDMDGVLVEQVIPVLEKLKQEMDVDLKKCDITDWEYPIKETNIKIEIERAEREEEFVRQMPPMKDATEAMQILSGKFDIVIATSRESVTNSWSHNWLDSHGIPYKEFVNTSSQGKALPSVDLLIDDYIGNIANFIRTGTPGRQAILFAQPWNHDTRQINDLVASGKVRIAHSWKTVLAILGCNFPEE